MPTQTMEIEAMSKTAATQKNAKAGTTTTETPKVETTKKAATRDGLGCRVGSQSAAINAVIGNTPKSIATIAAESGATSTRCSNHLRYLLAKSLVVQSDEGFALPAPAKVTKRKGK